MPIASHLFFLSFFDKLRTFGVVSCQQGGDTMSKAYKILFNAITDCIRILIAAQQAAEEEVIK